MRDIHLITPLSTPIAGSEQRTLTLYRLLQDEGSTRPLLWSPVAAHADIAAHYPVRRLGAPGGEIPRGGSVIFIGTYFDYGSWLADVDAARVAVIANTNNAPSWSRNLGRLKAAGISRFDLVCTSESLRGFMGGIGKVLESLIDTRQFEAVAPAARPFTVGRLSRDETYKHHPEDVIIYQDVLARGGAVRLMGATALAARLKPSPSLQMLPAGAQMAESFLQGLDAFFYRTAPEWFEAFGRVVHEAMSCGLPVLCHRSVGAAAHIRHGENGLLFDTTGEALHQLDRLRQSPAWRQDLGAAARASMQALHEGTLRRATLEWLLA